ncbi:MAG: TIGR02281 family clan AA aspartic protease [Parahaliea sp.]
MNGDNEVHSQRRMGLVMQALAWLTLMALFGLGFSDLLEQQGNPNQSVETRYTAEGLREVTLKRNRYGHYVTSGRINGEPVVFMLDTGATGVALPESIARRLGLQPGRRISTQTANGTGTAYAVELDEVSVGDIALADVPASILPGLATGEVLLGMSFLRHIEFTQRGDTLVLRQHGGMR